VYSQASTGFPERTLERSDAIVQFGKMAFAAGRPSTAGALVFAIRTRRVSIAEVAMSTPSLSRRQGLQALVLLAISPTDVSAGVDPAPNRTRETMARQPANDPVEYESAVAFATTLERITTALEAAGMTVFASIDHAAGARAVGMTMPPTTVMFYGNPKGGTPIMQSAPQVALDLPLRVLIREDGKRALVSFHPATPMLRAAGVPEALSTRLEPAQRLIVQAIQP